MRKLLAIALLISGTLFMVSCGEDDTVTPTFDDPTVTITSAPTSVENASTGNVVVFSVTVDADLTLAIENLNVTTSSNVTNADAVLDGTTVTVTFDVSADNSIPGTINLAVEDSEGGTDDETASFVVNAVGDNAVTLFLFDITDEDAEPFQIIAEGDGVTISDFGLQAADGLASFTVSVNGGDAVELVGVVTGLAVGVTDSLIAAITIPASSLDYTVGKDDNLLLFTATDTDGDAVNATYQIAVAEAVVSYSASESVDDDGNEAVDVVGEIGAGESVTWDASLVYVITGRLIVSGTLTIPAGTVIKGETGSGVGAKAIIVAAGGTLNANGTAALPIIMTSINDALSPTDVVAGDYVGSLAADVNGLWGGLIVLGNAPISASATSVQIEGIPTSVAQGLYGGDAPTESSGSITYVSVRHGGSNIGAGNEINGITFGGVGSGTTVNWVEVVANQDDGIEWFGGNVNVSNALIWNSGDDSMDSDQDWQGTVDGFIIVTPDGSAFELDGPEGAAARTGGSNPGFHTFTNGTVYSGNRIGNLVDWDGSTNAALTNIFWFGIEADYTGGIADFQGDGVGTSSGWEAIIPAGATLSDIFNDGADAIVTSRTDLASGTVGVRSENGYEWTFASQAGGLSGIGL